MCPPGHGACTLTVGEDARFAATGSGRSCRPRFRMNPGAHRIRQSESIRPVCQSWRDLPTVISRTRDERRKMYGPTAPAFRRPTSQKRRGGSLSALPERPPSQAAEAEYPPWHPSSPPLYSRSRSPRHASSNASLLHRRPIASGHAPGRKTQLTPKSMTPIRRGGLTIGHGQTPPIEPRS